MSPAGSVGGQCCSLLPVRVVGSALGRPSLPRRRRRSLLRALTLKPSNLTARRRQYDRGVVDPTLGDASA